MSRFGDSFPVTEVGVFNFPLNGQKRFLVFHWIILSSVTNRKLNNTDTVSRKFHSKKNGCILSALPYCDIIPLLILLLSYII